MGLRDMAATLTKKKPEYIPKTLENRLKFSLRKTTDYSMEIGGLGGQNEEMGRPEIGVCDH